MAAVDPTISLAGALERWRTVVRQVAALGAALAVCVAWRLSRLDEPEPFVELLLVAGVGVLLVDLTLGWVARSRAAACADAIILSGFTGGTRTPVERAIARRLRWLERPRTRHRLAEHLRWRLRLAEGSLGLSPGYVRASVYPPLAAYERRALLANYGLVREVADRLERGPADPRGLVLLWSVVETPPSIDRGTAAFAAGEELARRLRLARGIIASAVPDGAWGDPGYSARQRMMVASAVRRRTRCRALRRGRARARRPVRSRRWRS